MRRFVDDAEAAGTDQALQLVLVVEDKAARQIGQVGEHRQQRHLLVALLLQLAQLPAQLLLLALQLPQLATASDVILDSHQQLGKVDRIVQVITGSDAKRANLGIDIGPRRHKQHRNQARRRRNFQLPTQLEAVHIGPLEIDDHQIHRLAHQLLLGRRTAVSDQHLQPRLGERDQQLLRLAREVIDQQHHRIAQVNRERQL